MSNHSESKNINTQELAEQFLLKLAEHNLSPTERGSYREVWTPAIITTLIDLAEPFECEAWPKHGSQEGKFTEEWVLDVIWKKGSTYCLGVESELGNKDEVLDDFEKLLWTKCPIKILIFVTPDGNSHKELHQQLREYIEQHPYHQKHERYLFFEINFWGEEDKPSKIHAYEFIVSDYLENKEINFRSIFDTQIKTQKIESLEKCKDA